MILEKYDFTPKKWLKKSLQKKLQPPCNICMNQYAKIIQGHMKSLFLRNLFFTSKPKNIYFS